MFSIGFGKELFGLDRQARHALEGVDAMPLGGYVQFAGDADAASRSPMPSGCRSRPRSANERLAHAGRRAAVAARGGRRSAGPAYQFPDSRSRSWRPSSWPQFGNGRSRPTSYRDRFSAPGSPAAGGRTGKPGDRVVIGPLMVTQGERMGRNQRVRDAAFHPGEQLSLSLVERGGTPRGFDSPVVAARDQ